MKTRKSFFLILALMILANLGANPTETWNIFPGTGANVAVMGTGNHVLKLTGISVSPSAIRRSEGIILEFDFHVAHNSGRRIVAWTDLSGDAPAINDYMFATPANQAAGKVARSALIASGDSSASVTIPAELLYDVATGRVASAIYVSLTTDNPDAHLEPQQRGGSARNNVNGINLAKEFDIFDTVTLSVVSDPTSFDWSIFVADSNVAVMGTGNHVLRLADIGISAGVLRRSEGVTLDIDFRVAHNSGRRIVVWTDLSGDAPAINDYMFATPANQAAGKVARSALIASGDSLASVTIPRELLYDETTGRIASAIYVSLTTDNPDAHLEPQQRGGSARNNVNGINLAREFDIFDTVTVSAIVDPPSFDWIVFPNADANLIVMGTGSHLLKLTDIGIAPGLLGELTGAVLEFDFHVAHNSGRRIVVWTDLSGDAPEIEDYMFATPANQAAGKVVRSDLIASGNSSSSVTIPKTLLYDSVTDRTASVIYVLLTTDNPDAHLEPQQRGGSARNNVNGINLAKEFDIFNTVALSITLPGGVETIFTHITLTPGANAAREIGFAWFTEKGFTRTAILQLVKKSELVDGGMPANPMQFTGVNGAGSSVYDTNKVTVTGLENNTEYAYRVGNGEEWSNVYTFRTFDPNASYNVIVVADPQVSAASDIPVWRDTATKAVAQANAIGGAVFMLNAGDNTNYGNDLEEVAGFLAPRELLSLPMAHAVGNHENDLRPLPYEQMDQTYMPLLYNWPNYHDLRNVATQPQHIRGGGNFYFSYGNTLYIVLNTNADGDSAVELHRAFMDEAYASHPDAVWRIAVFHHDLYGVGDHAGSGYGDSARRQPYWSPFLDEYKIDVAFNGHDHIYARSYFIRNDTIQRWQMPTILDPTAKTNINSNNPGTYISPNGILYMALSTAGTKFYSEEAQPWVSFTQGRVNVPEYSIMTIDGGELMIKTYRTDTGAMTDSITLRKTATYEDLQSLIRGCEALPRGDILMPGWLAFQAEILKAKAVSAVGPRSMIHDAYVALYNAFYALETPTDKTALGNLIEQVTGRLATATEGRWAGQYPPGSMAVMQDVLEDAVWVYELRLANIAENEAAYNALSTAFARFESMASVIPRPWVDVHEIRAAGVNTVALIDWMDDSETFVWGNDPQIRHYAHHTKQTFAKDLPDAPRTESPYGPVNQAGGRGKTYELARAHITKTHIGEWIRYELNVERAGSYRVALGAANSTAKDQIVLLRDTDHNILTRFVVPANSPLPASGWDNALMVQAQNEIYLPTGRYIIELFFVNDGVAISTREDAANPTAHLYPDGADVDILTFERTGDGRPPAAAAPDPRIIPLPLPAQSAAGAPHRQQGWATDGFEDEWGMIASAGLTVDIFKAATHLVLEVVGRPTSSDIQMQLQSDADNMNWNQTVLNIDDLYSSVDGVNTLTFDLSQMLGFAAFRAMESSGRILVSYYSLSWDELNVMKAYLIVDPQLLPADTFRLRTTEGLVSAVPPNPVAGSDLAYTVQEGETLWSVAFNYYGSMGASVTDRITAANAAYFQRTGGALQAGTVITLPAEGLRAPVTQTHLNRAAGMYLVKAGDTLAMIALHYYGDMYAWHKIYEANRDRITLLGPYNPLIYEKQWLVIPR